MSRKRAPKLNFDARETKAKSSRGGQESRNAALRSAYAPPPCLVSTLALGLMIGSGSAIAGTGSCDPTASNFTCTGIVNNPEAFTPTADFTVNIGTSTPTEEPAYIQQSYGFAGRVFINNTFLSSIAGKDDGVHLRHTDGNASISNRFGSQISGERGNGIDIYDAGNGVRITNDFGSNISGNVNGVKAGDVRGNVTLSNVAASISGSSESGVDVSSVRGDVEIRNALGTIHGGNDGIRISDADGNIAIQNAIGSGISGDRESGIDIGGGGRVAIDNAGVIAGLTNALTIESGTAQINSSGLISGSGESDSVIKLSTTAGATINNNEGGIIRGFLMSPSDLAIEASGGAVTINNAGTIWGRVDLSSAGNTDTPNVFNNSSNNSWHVLGTSNLGNGLADSFNNTGTVYVTDPNNPAAGDVTVITGVEYFNNGGPGGAGTIELQDGHTGDVFMLSPTGGGSLVFNGAPGQSVLKVDSFLGTASGTTTDSLVVNGSVTGSTAIQLNNINPSFGSFNPVGALVVSATGSLPPNSFYLSGGPIDTGMFTYDLYRKGPEEWVLASAPNHAFFELPSITSAAQSIWHSVAGGWLDRTADLRTALEGTCDVGSLKDPTVGCKKPASGAWAKVLGSSESRSTGHSFTVLNTTQRTSVDTQLEGGGVIGGYDFIRSTDDGSGIWLAGVMGGYEKLRSETKRLGCGNVSFHGYQPRHLLAASLSAADVHIVSLKPDLEGLIVPSKFYGIAAAGRPMIFIGSPHGEAARLIEKYGCGASVGIGNTRALLKTINSMAGNPKLCASMGQQARAMCVEAFSKASAISSWHDLIEGIADVSRSKSAKSFDALRYR